MNDAGIAARIDRLPIATMHRRLLWIFAIPLFFDVSDIFTFSYAAPVLVGEWGLTIHQVALTTAAGFLGMFLGSTFGGMLADRIGRKRALILFVLVASGFSLATGLAFDVPSLLATRLLTGVGISSSTVVVITYIAELFPAALRGKWQSWAMVIALLGIPITSWVARLVVEIGPEGWRWIFVWGALGLPYPLLAARLTESPRWLARRGRIAEAAAILDGIEAEMAREGRALPPPAPSPRLRAGAHEAAVQPPRWSALFAPHQAKRTLTLCAIWFFQTIGYYGFMSWVPTLLAQKGIAVVQSLTYASLITGGAAFGALFAVLISERVERKFAIVWVALAIGSFGMLYGLSSAPALIVGFGFLTGTLMQSFSTLAFAYTPEQFPTELRNSGAGLAYGIGRLANVANPFVIAAIFTNLGYAWVFAYIGGAWAITALIALAFGARTTGRPLEAISADTPPAEDHAIGSPAPARPAS